MSKLSLNSTNNESSNSDYKSDDYIYSATKSNSNKGYSDLTDDTERDHSYSSWSEHSCRDQIRLSELPEVGLIFVRSEDILSRIAISITKQPYSTIGFFYKNRISGRERICLVMLDMYRFTTPTWLEEGDTLEDWIDNPLVSSIILKGLRPIFDNDGEINKVKTDELHTDFRAAIGEVLEYGPESSPEEIISQLFGYQIEYPTKSVTPVEMISRVIMKIGKWDLIKQNGSLSADVLNNLNCKEILDADSESKVKMLENLTAKFNQQEVPNPNVSNLLMQSYIVDNPLFDSIIEINLPERDIHMVRQAQSVTAVLNSDYMSSLVSKFVHMIIHSQGFFETVLTGFNENRAVEIKEYKSLRKSIFRLADSAENMASLVTEWIHNGELNYQNLLSKFVEMNQDRSTVERHHQISLGEKVRMPYLDQTKTLLLKKSRSHESNNNLMGSYLHLRTMFRQLCEDVRAGNAVSMDLNTMLSTMNDMGQAMGLGDNLLPIMSGNFSVSASISLSSDSHQTIPINLKSGSKIILTTKNPNLTNLDIDTLYEIIHIIDGMADEKNGFDDLRTAIVRRIQDLN